jgi:undecaprenyl-diphosphatase
VIEHQFRSPLVVAATLAAGGLGLILAERIGRKTRDARTLGYGEALAIGCAQALALVPGISRSGATLTLAMFLNVERA